MVECLTLIRGRRDGEFGERGESVCDMNNLMALRLQQPGDNFGDGGVVFYQHDAQ